MSSWINRFHSKKILNHLGDPEAIVAYVDGLESEIALLKQEIASLKVQLENKTADVQYWESVNRYSR